MAGNLEVAGWNLVAPCGLYCGECTGSSAASVKAAEAIKA